MLSIIPIQVTHERLWQDNKYLLSMHFNLEFCHMTSSPGHDIPLACSKTAAQSLLLANSEYKKCKECHSALLGV